MLVTILDYGLGNITSVERAFQKINAQVLRTSKAEDIESAEALVLPGVGAFGRAMENLSQREMLTPLKGYLGSNRPYLGICLGMQVLLSQSREHGYFKGLGIIEGSVEKLPEGVKVPHMGWNQVEPTGKGKDMFSDIPENTYFYFNHSYHVVPEEDTAASLTGYGEQFVSAVTKGKIWGVQFHPEKSSCSGLKLLRNFMLMASEGKGYAC